MRTFLYEFKAGQRAASGALGRQAPWPTAVGWTIEAEIQDGFAHDAL